MITRRSFFLAAPALVASAGLMHLPKRPVELPTIFVDEYWGGEIGRILINPYEGASPSWEQGIYVDIPRGFDANI